MPVLAMITARGGSKRIPGKNTKDFCGKPIIAYSIEIAFQSGLFDEVMVSTDSEEIAGIARAYGASVPFMRSAETSGDMAPTVEVCREVPKMYEKRRGRGSFNAFCCLYPTEPLLRPEKLQEAYRILMEGDEKPLSVYPVTAFSFPPQRGVYLSEDQKIIRIHPEHRFTRSQDLPKVYHDCGQFYFINTARFEQIGYSDIQDETSRAIIMEGNDVQDIDTPEDWALAELKYQLKNLC